MLLLLGDDVTAKAQYAVSWWVGLNVFLVGVRRNTGGI
jgi:hypothetical protein